MNEITRAFRWPFVVTLLLVLLVAAGLRLYRLPELPLGLHYDEAANGILAAEIAGGNNLPIFIPSYTGKEVLFFYWAALWMKLLGVTPLALRLSAALVGLATVAATVWATHELLHQLRNAKWIALLTAAFLATSFWHLVLSRYGFRAVTQPLLQALTVAALWRGLRTEKKSWLALAGLFCGLTAYTYLAARAFPIPLAAALLALLAADRGHRRARLGQIALFVGVAVLTLAPLAHYWLTHPGSFMNRAQQVAAASWPAAWNGIRACLGMFFLKGDPYIRFNLPQRPLFDPVTAALFLLGLVIAVWKFARLLHSTNRSPAPLPPCSPAPLPHRPPAPPPPRSSAPPPPCPPAPPPPRSSAPLHLASCILLLVLFPIMLLPSAFAAGEITPSNLRAVGLLPFIYIFPALGLWAILARVRRLLPTASRLLPLASCTLLLASCLLLPALAYFDHWATSAELYYAADGELADIAAYLDQVDLTNATPYVASIHYRHPTLAFLADDYDTIRWLTGGRTIIFPAEGDGLLLFPRSASNDLDWAQSVLPDDALIAAPPGPDGAPAFHVYRVGPNPDLTPTHPLTADLAHTALLLGYDVLAEPASGGNAEIAVWWRVLNAPAEGDYGPVARLTDPWGFVWGEIQPFHYPSEQWTPGEMIVDHLSIPVGPGAPPGDYVVRFGLYSAQADAQLPILDNDGRYTGEWVELPLRLTRAAAPPAPEGIDIRNRLNAESGGLTLLGANLDTTTARPGERLYLTLFWRADESPLPDHDVTLTLGGTTIYAGAPVHGAYPTSRWAAGEIVADRYDPRLPRDAPPGDHPLRLRVGDTAVNLGAVTVQVTGRTFDVPPISHPLTATLGNQIELLGYDLSAEAIAPGDTLALTLYWRALAEMDESYTVFAHLVAPDGSMTGQRDSPPVGGSYPTNLWLIGEVIADVYEVPIPADAAPGEHQLEVGMYVAESGARLLITDTSQDALFLQAITVTVP